MSVDINNSPYAPPPSGPRSQEGLGYSRHYAQRIRDMGKTSKESWIKRLWNHMFSKKNGDMVSGKGRPKDQQQNNNSAPRTGTNNDRSVKFASAVSPAGNRSQPQSGRDTESRSAPARERPKILPAQLADSPYIPQGQKPNYTVEPSKAKPQSGPAGSAGQSVRKKEPPSPFMRKPTHPYLATHPEVWKPKQTRAPSTIQLEKRAKSTADKAMKSAKIFSCQGPYPVDAYVRFSLRKRGWVEKFGPSANNNKNRDNVSTNKLEDAVDEDFEAICEQDIPPPWLEDHGVYAMMSRVVRHYPAKFIWGSRGVNSLVLRSETIVNHFPKARYFSSKVCLAGSLKELPWLNSADPLDFFPRCYVLNEEEKDDITEDFRTTACISMLKWVVSMYITEDGEVLRSELLPENTKDEELVLPAEPCRAEESASKTDDIDADTAKTDTADETPPPLDQDQSDCSKPDESEAQPASVDGDGDGDRDVDADADADAEPAADADVDDEFNVDDLQDPTSVKGPISKNDKPRVLPDLQPKVVKKGGKVPAKSVEWALAHCYKYLLFKSHDDIDSRRRGLSLAQWNQLLKWYNDVSMEGASVPVTESRLRECQEVLRRMRKVWPQFDIDGLRDIWIIKPGDKSKGIGIEFLNNLDDILKYADNTTTAGTYVVQKYIERPLLVYECKFDIRQWFVVTDWNPLTIWFYKESYLRICSQEYNYESMHESIHLSNVAIQQFYLNGNRSEKLPDNNFMVSTEFRHYLADEIGAPHAWDEIIYPGMKHAVINTLLATMDVTENRKNGFELYGADFMMSEDFRPWLLEINASPGMAPCSKQKAKLCAAVIEDTIKVVLDRRENKSCGTGGYELIFRDSPMAPSRVVETKFMLEGQRIRKNDLQRYTQLDQKNIKVLKDKETKELERQYEREVKEREEKSRRESMQESRAESAMTDDSKQHSDDDGQKELDKKEDHIEPPKKSNSGNTTSTSKDKAKADGGKSSRKDEKGKQEVKKKDSKQELNSKTKAIYESKPVGSMSRAKKK